MRALGGFGQPPKALFVGGCVRNELLGVPVGDIDIATVLEPEEVIRRCEGAGIKTVPTGIEHGTVTVVVNKKPFEITTLRRDVKTDGRRAVVAFTDDWTEDARRRDFTMNTLLAGPDGAIFDPTGQGQKDLEARHVIFVGDPATRIAEDYLRVLRFFRFHAVYGQGDPDAGALAACRAAADKIGTLSRERITQEFTKILMMDNSVDIISIMFENNILKDVADDWYKPKILQSLAELQDRYSMPSFPARLLVLAGNIDEWLILSNAQKKEMANLGKFIENRETGAIPSDKGLIYRFGADIAGQAFLLLAARGKISTEELAGKMNLVRNWRTPDFPLSGDDVMATGIPAGPGVGKILKAIEQWWMGQDCEPGREECLFKLKSD